MIGRALSRLFNPIANLLLAHIPVEDPWERIRAQVRPAFFGPGSRRDFRWYFEGESTVVVDSVDAIGRWLVDCRYVDDMDLFHERDFWQHPRTFEQLRRGDCEDHALWAWRKLTELGIDAEFVSGRWNVTQAEPGGHAWVIFRDARGGEYLLESVTKDATDMVRPLRDVRAQYIPHFAINRQHETVAFAGYILEVQRRRSERKAGTLHVPPNK